MLYIKVAVVSLVIGIPVFLLSSFLEYGVSVEELSSVDYWLKHPLGLFAYAVITPLVLFLFQSFGGENVAGSAGVSSDKEQGNVKWFNSSKGYGFIARNEGEDVFVHYRSIVGKGHRSLFEGQVVEFSVSSGEKGLQADDVVVVSDVKRRGRGSRK